MDLVISIVNYNTKKLLHQCLQSIFSSSTGLKYQVYVVDNHSLDESSKMLESLFPQVFLIRNDQNRGFAQSNNQIIRMTSSKYILILNPDIIVTAESIHPMVNFMDQHPEIGILGCKLFNPDHSIQFSCRRYPNLFIIFLRGLYGDSLFPYANIFRRYLMAEWDHSSIAEVDWVIGSCMMLRREALEEVGLFDEGFFMYYEDVDLCLRMWKDWKVYYYPDSYMIHHHLQESHKVRAVRQRWIHIASAYRFFKKHGPFPRRNRLDRSSGVGCHEV